MIAPVLEPPSNSYLSHYPPGAAPELHPTLKQLLELLPPDHPNFRLLGVESIRKMFHPRLRGAAKLRDPIESSRDMEIAGPRGNLKLRVYRPLAEGILPVALFAHGGGWVSGNLDTCDDMARSICHGSKCVVVSVDYGLSPENPYPGPVEDCYAALLWVFSHASELGADPHRIGFMGDSCGGNLAIATVLASKRRNGPEISSLVVAYAGLNPSPDLPSRLEFREGYGLTTDSLDYLASEYMGRDYASSKDILAFPALALPFDFRGFPRTLIICAHFDPLRDDSLQIAELLHRAEVPVRCRVFTDMNHGFLHYAAAFPSAKVAIREAAEELRQALYGDGAKQALATVPGQPGPVAEAAV